METRKLIHVNLEAKERAQVYVDKMNTQSATLKRIFKQTIGDDANIGDIIEKGSFYFYSSFWAKYKKLYPPVSNAQKIYEDVSGVSITAITQRIHKLKTALKNAPISLKTNDKDEFVFNVSVGHWNVYLADDKKAEYKLAKKYLDIVNEMKDFNPYCTTLNALRYAPNGWVQLAKSGSRLEINPHSFK